jgi:hypothetical protein
VVFLIILVGSAVLCAIFAMIVEWDKASKKKRSGLSSGRTSSYASRRTSTQRTRTYSWVGFTRARTGSGEEDSKSWFRGRVVSWPLRKTSTTEVEDIELANENTSTPTDVPPSTGPRTSYNGVSWRHRMTDWSFPPSYHTRLSLDECCPPSSSDCPETQNFSRPLRAPAPTHRRDRETETDLTIGQPRGIPPPQYGHHRVDTLVASYRDRDGNQVAARRASEIPREIPRPPSYDGVVATNEEVYSAFRTRVDRDTRERRLSAASTTAQDGGERQARERQRARQAEQARQAKAA